MDLSFFERTRARYLKLAEQDDSIVVINANQALNEVQLDITAALTQWYQSL